MTRVKQPHQVVIQQSEPFLMKWPQRQADMFKLLMRVLYYLVGGHSHAGYFAAKTWNHYYMKVQRGGVSRWMAPS